MASILGVKQHAREEFKGKELSKRLLLAELAGKVEPSLQVKS